jgi:hypothetical protein
VDTFTITAYSAPTDVATVTFVLQNQSGFTGGTFAGNKLKGVPKDTVANVKTFMRQYVDSYIQGKKEETAAAANVSSEVAALLNVATGF